MDDNLLSDPSALELLFEASFCTPEEPGAPSTPTASKELCAEPTGYFSFPPLKDEVNTVQRTRDIVAEWFESFSEGGDVAALFLGSELAETLSNRESEALNTMSKMKRTISVLEQAPSRYSFSDYDDSTVVSSSSTSEEPQLVESDSLSSTMASDTESSESSSDDDQMWASPAYKSLASRVLEEVPQRKHAGQVDQVRQEAQDVQSSDVKKPVKDGPDLHLAAHRLWGNNGSRSLHRVVSLDRIQSMMRPS